MHRTMDGTYNTPVNNTDRSDSLTPDRPHLLPVLFRPKAAKPKKKPKVHNAPRQG